MTTAKAAATPPLTAAFGRDIDNQRSRPKHSCLTVVSMVLSLGLLGLALRNLPLGTAYAVWTGIGTIGTVIFGILVFGESAGAARLFSVALIVAGIVGLKLVTP